MWMFLGVGFFSVVLDKNDATKKKLMIRTRIDGDLEALRSKYLPELSPTLKLAGSDYPYRAFCAKPELAAAMVNLVFDIDYTNFKNMIASRQSMARERLYARVWGVMHDGDNKLKELEDDEKKAQKGDWYKYGTGSGTGWSSSKSSHNQMQLIGFDDTPPSNTTYKKKSHCKVHQWDRDKYGVYCVLCQKVGSAADLARQKGILRSEDEGDEETSRFKARVETGEVQLITSEGVVKVKTDIPVVKPAAPLPLADDMVMGGRGSGAAPLSLLDVASDDDNDLDSRLPRIESLTSASNAPKKS
jgi:hypothetical protein